MADIPLQNNMNTNTNNTEALIAIADTLSKAVEQLRLLAVPPKTLTITYADCTHTYVNHLFNDCFKVFELAMPVTKTCFEKVVAGEVKHATPTFLKYLLNGLEDQCTPEFYQKIFDICNKSLNKTSPQTVKLFNNVACIPSNVAYIETIEQINSCKFSQEDRILYNCLRQISDENKDITQLMYDILKRNVPEKMFALYKLI